MGLRQLRLHCVLWVGALAVGPSSAAAHVRWFIPEGQFPPDWDLLFRLPTLAVIAVSGLFYVVLRGLQHLVGTPHFPNPRFLAYMEPSATALLAVQTGISLVWFASQRHLFVPNLPLPPSLLGWFLVAGQLFVAFTLITGLFDRIGALFLILVYGLGFFVFPPVAMIDQSLYIGIGLALFVLGRSIPPPAVAQRLHFLDRYERPAVAALRILTGCSILLVAFTEKLLAPEAGLTFLQEYPGFNFPRMSLGWSWLTNDLFVLTAGVAEATIGILLISGVLTRVVILAMWIPFNAAVAFVPPEDLLGHLPIFGIMYVLLLYGSGIDPKATERRLEPALTEELAARHDRVQGESAAGNRRRGPE